MDEASRIVADLQLKLKELDHKVCTYRHDISSEYLRYEREVLRNVTHDVSSKVTEAITASLKNYPSLHPELQRDPTTASTSIEDHQDTNVTHDEPPRSPHAREREFTGLFTPSYLPLLDSTDRNERRSSQDMSQAQPSEAEKSHHSNSPVMQTIIAHPENPSTPTVILQRPPTPLRKNTDTSVLSNSSDSDSSALRKSALRRSSSSASQKTFSPRRVRFALEGGEFSTDSTPNPTIQEEPPPKRQAIILGYYNNAEEFGNFENDDEEAGSEQVENIEDPPPKRISSSQALRALSRGPLEDDGTKWTVVAAPPDGSASVPVDEEVKDGKAYIDADEDVTGVTGAEAEIPAEQDLQKLSQNNDNDSSQHIEMSAEGSNEKATPQSIPINSTSIPSSDQIKTNGLSATKQQVMSEPSPSMPTSIGKPLLKKKQSTFSLGESDSESESDSEPTRRGNNNNNEDDDDGLFDFEEGDGHSFHEEGEVYNRKENDFGTANTTNSDISRFSPSDLLSPRLISGFIPGEAKESESSSSLRGGSLGTNTLERNPFGQTSDQYETKPRYITSSSLPRRESYHDFKRSGSSSSLRGEEQHGYANMNSSYNGIPYQYGRDGSHSPTGQTQTVGTPSGIDYSYKGSMSRGHPHPFSQPIATERVQKAAQEMGDMKSWVGSVDGRSGVDDRIGDSGFRGSLGMAGSLREGGQPRSLSERMVMEEEMSKAAKGRHKK